MPSHAFPVGVVDDPVFDRHRSRGHHPERPERLRAARAALDRARLQTIAVAPRDATEEELLRVHEAAYLDDLARMAGREGHLDADTYIAADSIAAAWRAAGSACSLVDALLEGRAQRGLALLRPPGHHARPDQAMGFCLLNNIAIAAAHARAHGLRRVAVIDWDVHHGNGTQEMFWEDPSVLYASIHQSPCFPGTGDASEMGEGDGLGATVNVPLSAGAGDAEYAAAFERVIVPILDEFRPELVLVSAGFDAHRNDPIAGMRLDPGSFARMTRYLLDVAERHASGRIALVLEGGYDLSGLEASLLASLRTLAGEPPSYPSPTAPSAIYDREIERARKLLSEHWPSLG